MERKKNRGYNIKGENQGRLENILCNLAVDEKQAKLDTRWSFGSMFSCQFGKSWSQNCSLSTLLTYVCM